ncbi:MULTISPECIES: MBL fold metallo-hydrolase [unclassified Chelatococcus]|uniref:MBL fold metallo-hydrolase n=1 Tax=unclassified Chelatococcus TaxID=2638111 RepID=UPI001BCEBCF0|nr:MULTISPECIES: MBL fold metallo-hydrolase [unclassified Chelatococcus]CAH1660642.1 Glyoxylase-like metal-dependent hydrolase (Beta-lactamase superfamily II) [Hyphomicrobiales bacterium]MBS7741145.1 MBL fold metallo-hydrolase [Chelatococcus sp. HY11]MBX3545331.1 MBL fold metallo-hydrolase [Chelatococcus sp.]MCO5077963.1 MBL fold metallo-hydrolase [Chelatococcus sp.]CAH1683354.1 Glyoxylase-like metal-dependent hydrolase (Beta-lactamase superfamily II) [Hyphomicrobiales bacterium]
MRQLDLGGATLFALTDAAPSPAEWSYSFPKADVSRRPDLMSRWFPDHRFHTRFNAFALRIGDEVVLIDCGIGAGPVAYFPGLSGRLLDELATAGIQPDDVDFVLFTHFHLDHVGWASDTEGVPTFRKARYLAPVAEMAHWQKAGDDAALPHHVAAYRTHIAPLIAAGTLTGHSTDTPVMRLGATELSLLPAPGHTEGHSVVTLSGTARPLLTAGDLWHSPAQIGEPHWCHRADRDPAQAILTRMGFAAFAATEGAVVAAGHFPEDRCFGAITGNADDGFAFEPLPATQSSAS